MTRSACSCDHSMSGPGTGLVRRTTRCPAQSAGNDHEGCRLRIQPARIVFPPQDRAEVAAAITETLTTGALTLGPWTKKFEAAFAAAHQTPNAIAVASGTCSLEIIVPANTFYATAAAVLRAGGRPVFADIDAATFALTQQTVEAVLTPDTKAV